MELKLEVLAKKIDSAAECEDISLLKLLAQECEALSKNLDGPNASICYFLLANCSGSTNRLKQLASGDLWSWRQNELVTELLYLRKAVSNDEFSTLDLGMQCKILTNMAGTLSQLGRPAEAINTWDEAISKLPNFAMALGNKGICLISYAESLYDYGHTAILKFFARANLLKSLEDDAFWDSGEHPEVWRSFANYCGDTIEFLDRVAYDSDFDLNEISLGSTDGERTYRTWCLEKKLFLSPLNDACAHSAAAQDVLHLPTHMYKIDESPRFVGYYNVLKQEYATARHLMFEGMSACDEHYSDDHVLLLYVGDGAQFSYKLEKLKISFRLMYSLLDKVALFVNDYFSVGLAPQKVNFRQVWGVYKNDVFEFYEVFKGSKNLPLRGLYYLSKELFDPDFKDASSPDTKNLAKLRNNSEHRFLSLNEGVISNATTEAYTHIGIQSFEEKTLRVARLARESLIYLSLAMHHEESVRDRSDTGVSAFIQSVPIER